MRIVNVLFSLMVYSAMFVIGNPNKNHYKTNIMGAEIKAKNKQRGKPEHVNEAQVRQNIIQNSIFHCNLQV